MGIPMKAPTSVLAANLRGDASLKLAAAGDVHCSEDTRDAVLTAFDAIDGEVDAVLLAGDLTTHGEPEQAAVLADACRSLETPVLAVLGNHDWHADRHDELVEALRGGGIEVLDPGSAIVSIRGVRVGIAGAKGFIGGFAGSSHLPDFGEPSLRRIYAEATAEIYGLDEGLREISTCDLRIALLHYAPTSETLEGEPGGIWAFLGSDRLAAPILEHEPDLALHGHAHAGAYEGRIGSVPVYNVSVPVIRRDFQVFELTPSRSTTPIH
jgi:Icc-related predicted phosphoesterase